MADARVVSSATELSAALEAGAKAIEVRGEVSGMPMITLGPAGGHAARRFHSVPRACA